MTIHKAKGLEFPVVCLAGMHGSMSGQPLGNVLVDRVHATTGAAKGGGSDGFAGGGGTLSSPLINSIR